MIKDDTYTVIATSVFVAPQIFKHLTKSQAQTLAWELKDQQYKVSVEVDEPLEELGICHPID
jgi:ribose 1,5-bisphosphokinase PhnN